jgi:uncharacterized protein (DUF169 family)
MKVKVEFPEQVEQIEQNARYTRKLQETLGLDGSPVAVALSDNSPRLMKSLKRRSTPCMMIQMARRGGIFYCPGERILCGGRAHLGMGESIIHNLDEFLVRKEKLFGSKTAARTLLNKAKALAPDNITCVSFSPLELAHLTPDVIIIIGTPAQISRIIFLNAFNTGEVEAIHGEPLCSGVIALPIKTARIGISFLDVSCRVFGKYKPEEMAIGIPYQRLPYIVENIALSTAGIAKPARLLQLTGRVLRRWVPDG